MATNGIVSILKDGKMKFKCVAGSDGMKAEQLAKKIKCIEFDKLNIDLLHNLCVKYGFGNAGVDLVIQSKDENYFKGNYCLAELYEYKKIFENPNFNPRWQNGLADYTEIINY